MFADEGINSCIVEHYHKQDSLFALASSDFFSWRDKEIEHMYYEA